MAHWSRDRIVADLRRLGVVPGTVVMVHTSLRAIGPVDGGAATVIAALDDVVGAGGTVLVNIGVRDDWGWVNDLAEHDRVGSLSDAEPFDLLTTPAEPDNGVLAEVFRTTPGTLVSDHPEGRFAARGSRAADLVRDVPWDHYYGPGSPLERLVEFGGCVLRLGADQDTVTLAHYAEYLAEVPRKRVVRRHRRVASPGGPVIRVVECLDDSDGIAAWPGGPDGGDYFPAMLQAYLAAGRACTGTVGGAHSELFDAADFVRFAADWMTRELVPFDD